MSMPERSAHQVLARAARLALVCLGPLVVLIVVSELLLAALGLGDPDEQLSLSRGFDPRARYLVPVADTPGAWRTQMFEGRAREQLIPPRGAARRVLLVGGSNTAGFPEQELQRRLAERTPGVDWEVFNLGRPGYGSERVAIIVEQALALRPDVLVVYSGHNEFVERGFALDLLDAGATPLWQRVDLLVSRLRTHNVIAELLAPRQSDWARQARRPETRGQRDARFGSMTYDETLFVYDVYRRNLRRVVDLAREHDVAVVLCTVVGNDLSPPEVRGWTAPDDDPALATFGKLLLRARELLPARLVDGLLPPLRLRWTDWRDDVAVRLAGGAPQAAAEPRPDAPPARLPRLRRLLDELAATPATEGDKLASVEGSHATDPALWSPRVTRLMATMEQLCDPRLSPAERRDVQRARGLYDQALDARGDDPFAHFERGLCDFILQAGDRGRADLAAAARLDRAPRRGNDLTNGIVRELAAEPGVTLLDAEALMRARSPDGVLGYELLMDVCHLQPGVRPVLMADMAAVVAGSP